MTPRAARGSGQQADVEPETQPSECHELSYEAGFYLTTTLEAQLQTAVQQSAARRLSLDGKPPVEQVSDAVGLAAGDMDDTFPYGLHLGRFLNTPVTFPGSMAFFSMRLFAEEGAVLLDALVQLPLQPSYEEALQWCAALK